MSLLRSVTAFHDNHIINIFLVTVQIDKPLVIIKQMLLYLSSTNCLTKSGRKAKIMCKITLNFE